MGDFQRPFRTDDLDDLRDNLVCLDDTDLRTFRTYAKTLTLTDITQRGSLHCRTLQLHGAEDGNGGDGRGGTRPFYLLQYRVCCLVLPFEGKSCLGGMMSCDASGLCVFRIVVADNETVDRVGILFAGDLLRKGIDHVFHRINTGVFHPFVLHCLETLLFEPCHAVAPRQDFIVDMY